MGQLGRTTAAGDGKHRGSEMAIGVSCSGSDKKRWRTELELGSRKFLDDHHGPPHWGQSQTGRGSLTADACCSTCGCGTAPFSRGTDTLGTRGCAPE